MRSSGTSPATHGEVNVPPDCRKCNHPVDGHQGGRCHAVERISGTVEYSACECGRDGQELLFDEEDQ